MRKYMKSWLALGTAAMVAAGLTGCSGSKEAPATEAPKTETTAEAAADKTEAAAGTTEEKKELEGELEIVTNANEQTYNAVNEILEQFMKENPGVKISYTTQGSDYEQLMKARMASNDLPDIFVTHGWSVVRYSEYLRPLNDQPWFSQIEPSFMENIEDENGQVYVLPINMDQGGLIYNKKLLTELGVDIQKISVKKEKRKATPAYLSQVKTADSRHPCWILQLRLIWKQEMIRITAPSFWMVPLTGITGHHFPSCWLI